MCLRMLRLARIMRLARVTWQSKLGVLQCLLKDSVRIRIPWDSTCALGTPQLAHVKVIHLMVELRSMVASIIEAR